MCNASSLVRRSARISVRCSALMTAQSGEIKDTLVSCITNQGQELRATPVRVARFLAIFEVYNPMLVLRVSEALTEFKIVFQDRVVYSGRAVVRSLVSTNVAT